MKNLEYVIGPAGPRRDTRETKKGKRRLGLRGLALGFLSMLSPSLALAAQMEFNNIPEGGLKQAIFGGREKNVMIGENHDNTSAIDYLVKEMESITEGPYNIRNIVVTDVARDMQKFVDAYLNNTDESKDRQLYAQIGKEFFSMYHDVKGIGASPKRISYQYGRYSKLIKEVKRLKGLGKDIGLSLVDLSAQECTGANGRENKRWDDRLGQTPKWIRPIKALKGRSVVLHGAWHLGHFFGEGLDARYNHYVGDAAEFSRDPDPYLHFEINKFLKRGCPVDRGDSAFFRIGAMYKGSEIPVGIIVAPEVQSTEYHEL